jgi:hypothetical protein
MGCQVPGEPFPLTIERHDVTGDGRPDLFATAECPATTSSWSTEVVVFDGASPPGQPRLLERLGYDTGGYHEEVQYAVNGREVTLTGRGRSGWQSHAMGKDMAVHDRYRWSGWTFEHAEHYVLGHVEGSDVNRRAAPSRTAPVAGTVGRGDEVQLLCYLPDDGGWYRLTDSSYLNAAFVDPIAAGHKDPTGLLPYEPAKVLPFC